MNTPLPLRADDPRDALPRPPELPWPVKLVIWDLDETFWRGVLSEGPISITPANVEIVKALSRRGIVSSICSKNTHDDVVRELEDCGVWSYFVFPRIGFEAKGALIASIIDQANLRPQNVLFIDDNPLNLAEARHFAPGLMTADPADILPHLLDMAQVRGKDDQGLSRLRQYRNLEQKAAAQAVASGGAEAFLRDSRIEVSIGLDVEADFDRVVELVNRSNQLNFTKVRLETPQAQEAFRRDLHSFGAHAGTVHVRDRYGDYGLAGFFLLFNRAGGNRLVHFVFSCRVMHMGVEQFIYERLNCPAIDIVAPVANALQPFAEMDWIRLEDAEGVDVVGSNEGKLTLLGGCDLLQVANYCSGDRAEYVNHMSDGVITHYDDAGFVLSPRAAAASSTVLPMMPCWTAKDALAFDEDLGRSEIVIVSLWDAILGQYILTDDGVLVRVDPALHGLADYLAAHPDADFMSRCEFLEFRLTDKAKLVQSCLERIARLSEGARCRVVIGRNLQGTTSGRYLREIYNQACRSYCEETGAFHYVDLDEIIRPEDVVDSAHLTRMGYYRVASRVRAILQDHPEPRSAQVAAPRGRAAAPRIEIDDLARRALFRRTGAPLGRSSGRLTGWLHQAHPSQVARRLMRTHLP